METKLVNGRIPAHAPCPFRERCELFHACECQHKGELHTVDFSCGAARAFDLSERKGGSMPNAKFSGMNAAREAMR